MKESQLEPMSPEEKRVLERDRAFEIPPGAEDRVFAKLSASIAVPVAVAGVMATKTALALAGAMLIAGGAAGVARNASHALLPASHR